MSILNLTANGSIDANGNLVITITGVVPVAVANTPVVNTTPANTVNSTPNTVSNSIFGIPDPTAFPTISMPVAQSVGGPIPAGATAQRLVADTSGSSFNTIWWTVDANVASVDLQDSLTNNNAIFSDPQDSKQIHTAIYRLGGFPIPNAPTGYVSWKRNVAGTHVFTFTAYDDNGKIIDVVTKSLVVWSS